MCRCMVVSVAADPAVQLYMCDIPDDASISVCGR